MGLPTFDEDVDFRISALSCRGDEFRLEIEVSEVDSENRRTVRAECERILEYAVDHEFGSSLELVDQHPLLWEYQHYSASAYLSGVPANPSAAIGALVEAHWAAVNHWFSITKYLNNSVSLKSLLESGHGMLARGPVPLLEKYKLVLKEHGVEVDIISPYPSCGRLSDPEKIAELKTESRLLLIGKSYAIGLGWRFSDAESASVSELPRTRK